MERKDGLYSITGKPDHRLERCTKPLHVQPTGGRGGAGGEERDIVYYTSRVQPDSTTVLYCLLTTYTIIPILRGPRGLTFSWWGCYGLCSSHKPAEFAHSLLFCSCVCFCLYGPFNCISFHKFSRQLSAFSICSSGLISALSILSAIYLFMKVSLSPDVSPYGLTFTWWGCCGLRL